jgi:hypothetical protein
MAHRSDQIEMDEKSDCNVVFDTRQRVAARTSERTDHLATSCKDSQMRFTLEHNPFTDVMFVDLLPLEAGSKVEVIELGSVLGFPGQIQARVDREKEIFYGMTIQNYSGFRRTLLWRYRMWSVQRAIQLLVTTIIAGLCIDRSRHAMLPC